MIIKKVINLLIMVTVITIPFQAEAVVLDSTRYNNYCVRIENFQDFSDYEFLLTFFPGGVINSEPILYRMEEGKCQPIKEGFWGTRRLYAIRKNDLTKLNSLSVQDFKLPDLSAGATPYPSIVPFQYHREIGAWGDHDKKYNNIETIIKINKIGSKEGDLSRVNININETGKTEIIFKDDSWYKSFEDIWNKLQLFAIAAASLLL